jgi:predicted small lipoprotein YifL
MKVSNIASAAALLALTGCGGGGNLYTPIAGVPQTQTAESAYWDCVGQNFNREATSDPGAWLAPGAEWPGREAYMRYCMVQKGYAPKPHYELTTGTWQP